MAEMNVVAVVVMPVIMMVVVMRMVVTVVMVPLDLAVPASANSAHQITSISLIRISSPPSGISLPPPQSGHGSSRSAISTCFMQS